MYIDLVLFIVLIVIVIMFFKRFSSFVFFVAIVDVFLRILTFIKLNIGLSDVSALIGKYIPESIIAIIHKYSSGIVTKILDWCFVIIMIFFLSTAYFVASISIKSLPEPWHLINSIIFSLHIFVQSYKFFPLSQNLCWMFLVISHGW